MYYPFFNKVEAHPDRIYYYYTIPIIRSLISNPFKSDFSTEAEKKARATFVVGQNRYEGYNPENTRKPRSGRRAGAIMGICTVYNLLSYAADILRELHWTGDKVNDFTCHRINPYINDPKYNSYSPDLDSMFAKQPIGYKLKFVNETNTMKTFLKDNKIIVPY